MKRWKRFLGSATVVLLASYGVFHRLDGYAQTASAFEPHYTRDGRLLLPEGFTTWVFVGSNLGLGYSNDLSANTFLERSRQDQYHNVYISPEAYWAYFQNRTFPDKTVLVMDVYTAQSKEPKGVVDNGSFNGPRIGIEAAVKNKNRPDGQKTEWAYYDFTDRSGPGKIRTEAEAFPDAACYSCHKSHADDDNVWVQFYPTLRRIKKPE
jgi:hypothetical protein